MHHPLAPTTSKSDEVPVLTFPKFPSLHKAQADVGGKLWRISKIEMPYCWAAPWYAPGMPRKFRLEVQT